MEGGYPVVEVKVGIIEMICHSFLFFCQLIIDLVALLLRREYSKLTKWEEEEDAHQAWSTGSLVYSGWYGRE